MASPRSGAVLIRSCSAYQATAWATSPARSSASAWRSPGSVLTDVLVEDVDLAGVAVEQCPQGSAGTHRSQLAVVADEDDLGSGDLAGGEQPEQGRVVGHPGLVEDDDVAG